MVLPVGQSDAVQSLIKVTRGVSEVISTIMLNWIAIWVGQFLFGLGGPLQNDTQKSVPISNDIFDSAKLHVGFAQGVGLQFLNIKAWMLALAIVSGWVAGHADAAARLAVVMPVMLAYAFTSNLTYALAGSLLRHWLAGPDGSCTRLRWFNRIMALVLVLTVSWMLLR